MADCQVPWGPERLTLHLPEHWTLAQVAAPRYRPAPAEWLDRLSAALARPEGMAPLARLARSLGPAGRVAIVIEDITRHSPLEQILPRVLAELTHAGVGDDRIELLIATGMHPAMTAEQVREKVGPLAERLAWRCNDCRDRDGYVSLGVVESPTGRGRVPVLVDRGCLEADLRVLVTSISPHLQAGFGGGAKMLAPGMAHLETISRLHLYGLPHRTGPLVGTEAARNPLRTMVDAIGERVEAFGGQTFAVQYLLDDADRPNTIVAGDLRRGQQMLAKQCATAAGVVIDQPADILVVNAAPRDYDLWQSFKCIPNTRGAVRRNGVILALARCPGGLNMPAPRWPISPAWIRRIVRLIGVPGLVSLLSRFGPAIHPEARFFVRLALETIHRNPIVLYSPALAEAGSRFPGLTIVGDLDAAYAAADALLRNGSRRTIVFPTGGNSFPIATA